MPTTESSLRSRVPLIAALAALTLCLCAPQALARYVYSGNYSNGTVSVIDTATNQIVGAPIPLESNNDLASMAITPNGKTLYVAMYTETVRVIDTQTNQPGGSIPLGDSPNTIAISPDGKTAYVTLGGGGDAIEVIDTASNQAVGPPIPVGEDPYGVAFSPDGKTAYVTNEGDDNISVIDTATRQVVGPPIPVGEDPINVVVSPDGKTAYVSNEEGDSVSVIDTATNQTVGAPIPVGENAWGLALTPDGSRLYVSAYVGDTVTVIDTQSRQVVGAPIAAGNEPYELAVTPDGKTLYVTNYEGGGAAGSVSVIDTQTNQVSPTIPVTGGPWQLAIVPDQSPIPSFTFGASKKLPLRVSFSGAGSTDPDGTITRFDWSFGDGATAFNGGPSLIHKYAKAGNYPVSLTAVDNEGCSGMVFTGRTAHCNGVSTVTRSITAKAPNNFKFGKLKRNVRKGTAKLQIKLPSPGKLVFSGKKVKRAKRSAKEARKVTLDIRPKGKAKQLLATNGSAKVRVKVKFSPTGGKARTKGKTVKLILR